MNPVSKLNMEFSLREWHERDFKKIKNSSEIAKRLTTRVGRGSEKFKQACSLLGRSLNTGKDLSEFITSAITVRAFFHLLANNELVYKKAVVTPTIVTAIKESSPKLSILTFSYLVQSYINHYERFQENGSMTIIRYLINENLFNEQSCKRYSVSYNFKDVLFCKDAAQKIVNIAVNKRWDLDIAYKKLGLSHFSRGQLHDICERIYYLEKLKNIPVGSDDPILNELKKPHVYNSIYANDQLLGHEVMKIVIQRSRADEISDSWRALLLTIAGDPRIPTSAPLYQKWWSQIPEKLIVKVRGWLSRFDLELFLQALEQAAKEGADSEVERMFLPRKHFLQGLLDQDLILESKLFLGRKASDFLQRSFKPTEMPKYSQLRSSATSVIYLNLGKVHLVEGSHSFTLIL